MPLNALPSILKTAAILAVIGLVFLWVLFVNGCSKEQPLTTGQTVTNLQLPGWKGDTTYAVVQSSALPSLYQAFRDTLNAQGLVKWDERFDCNRFAGLFIGVAQARYAVAAWHSATPAQALALAEVWYYPDTGGHHAIVQARTELGDVYLDPQTGNGVTLTPKELANITLRKW